MIRWKNKALRKQSIRNKLEKAAPRIKALSFSRHFGMAKHR
jgi:hypothetical protein